MLKLKAKLRKSLGKINKSLRNRGFIPAVLYGHGIGNKNLEISYSDFKKIYEQAGASSLVELKIEELEPVKVIIHDIQLDPLNSKYLHVDFHQVRMDEKISTEILLKFVGEAKATKEKGAILFKNFDRLPIECFPQDLIHEIEVDLGKLNNLDDVITIADLNIPEKIHVLHKKDEIIAKITLAKEEEAAKPEEEVVTPEVIGDKSKEGGEESQESNKSD